MKTLLAVMVVGLIPFLNVAAQAPVANRVQFENDQVRVLKVTDVVGAKSELHEHPYNRVMVYLNDGSMRITYEDGRVQNLNIKAGDVVWSPVSGKHVSENTGPKPLTIVEIELKK
jgi:oxalate decarboxylase/phosphoglucose isomerase-like protein (cupin superfamily)